MDLKERLKLISKPKALLKSVKRHGIINIYKIMSPQPNLLKDMIWDNLIILDACRFDAFAQFNNIPGTLSKAISGASCTWNWLKINFSDNIMKDVVYFSTNPFISYYYLKRKIGHIPFYKIFELWKDNWSEELKTVHPSSVNKMVLESLDDYPQKRHIIHYLQPHHPFIGDLKIIDVNAINIEKAFGKPETENRKSEIFNQLKMGTVDLTTVWRAYISNLRLVLDYVQKILPALDGKTCITSDHGNAFGRFGLFFGHPPRTLIPELIEVPWLEVYTV